MWTTISLDISMEHGPRQTYRFVGPIECTLLKIRVIPSRRERNGAVIGQKLQYG